MAPVDIAMIGHGAVARLHAYAYRVAGLNRTLTAEPVLAVVAGRDAARAARAANSLGARTSTADWRQVIDDPAIDIIDICSPPGTHAEIVIAAAQAGKAIICEKPLAVDFASARAAADAVDLARVQSLIAFNYRHLPAVALMQQLVADGVIGTPRMWRSTWHTDEFVDASIPFDWRFDARQGGTTISDLGSHLIDLALWMLGPISSVTSHSATFVAERRDGVDGPPRDVTVDDASSALMRFETGAIGLFDVSRVGVGRPCNLSIEINGSAGTVAFDYGRLNELWLSTTSDPPRLYGGRVIRAEHPSQPETAGWWSIGQGLGYEASFVNQMAGLFETWPSGTWAPDIRQGLAVQAVSSAIEASARSMNWEIVPSVAIETEGR